MVESVAIGLTAGTIPLLLGLIATRAWPGRAEGPLLALCTAHSLAAGVCLVVWGQHARVHAGAARGWVVAAVPGRVARATLWKPSSASPVS